MPELIVPDSIKPETSVNLRNSLIYWARDDHAIWLRPRGYNLVQVPGVVAKLNLGANDHSIVSSEIRLSSGLPLIVALFLFLIYQGLGSMYVDGKPPPNLTVAWLMFGPMMVGWGCLMVLMLRRRMDRLMQDALQEIREMGATAASPGPWGPR